VIVRILPEVRSPARSGVAQSGLYPLTEIAGTNLREDCGAIRNSLACDISSSRGTVEVGALLRRHVYYGCSSYSHTVAKNGRQGYSVAEPPMR